MFDTPFMSTQLHAFAAENQEALQHAAYLLGGRPWLRRSQRLLDDLAQQGPVTSRMRREARALHRLLSLDFGHDPESPEAEFFAVLDPMDPQVEEICLLTEALGAAVEAVEVKSGRGTSFGEVAHD
ncbi:hypothetical protein [Marinovum sp.]|uniref:hypothetical protein n=1 Tax=Marinovum sp. TaxID=2024839 RepID=UPI003A918533